MDKEAIYYLEGRGQIFPYHFYVFVLGGLYYIFNKIKHEGPPGTSHKFFDSSKIISEIPELKFPIKIYMNNSDVNKLHQMRSYHFDSFEILKDKVEFVSLEKFNDYKIYSEYGETCINNPYSDNPEKIFPFIRNLFLYNFHLESTLLDKGKRIFITRKGPQKQHSGVIKRTIVNEDLLMKELKKYNFEYIQLENYSEKEKINLFNTSEIIISSHSSALTYCLFANKDSKIIEILNKGEDNVPNGHYKNMCNVLKLNYYRYSDIDEDKNGNFAIHADNFIDYLSKMFRELV